MPHIVRFSIMNDKDREVSLTVCRALGITPEDFARSAFFEAINEGIKLLKEREVQATLSKAEQARAEEELGVQGLTEQVDLGETNGKSTSRESGGDTPEVQLGEGTATSVLAESPIDAAEAATT